MIQIFDHKIDQAWVVRALQPCQQVTTAGCIQRISNQRTQCLILKTSEILMSLQGPLRPLRAGQQRRVEQRRQIRLGSYTFPLVCQIDLKLLTQVTECLLRIFWIRQQRLPMQDFLNPGRIAVTPAPVGQ